jgi:hypothetical protein
VLEGRDWYRVDGAPPGDIEALKRTAKKALPESYFALLAHSNGGEGPLATSPFQFQLDPALVTMQQIIDDTFAQFFPGLVVFGSNGGGEAIAFDTRGDAPFPIVAFDMTNNDLDESITPIAPDFDAFLDLVEIEN